MAEARETPAKAREWIIHRQFVPDLSTLSRVLMLDFSFQARMIGSSTAQPVANTGDENA
jgi:hypothetical protein